MPQVVTQIAPKDEGIASYEATGDEAEAPKLKPEGAPPPPEEAMAEANAPPLLATLAEVATKAAAVRE